MDKVIHWAGVFSNIVVAMSGGVLLVFTLPVFSLLDFHPIAVEFMQGDIDAGVLLLFRWDGQVFTSNEIGHFQDVKAMLGYLGWVCAISGAFSAALFVLARKAFVRACLLSPLVFAAIGAVVVGAFFVFGFERVGVFFHTIVFPGGNWRFPFDSLMIRLYGTDVMVTGAGFVIAATMVFLIIFAFLGRVFMASSKTKAI